MNYYHEISPSFISAEYDSSEHNIILSFDSSVELDQGSYASWNFWLDINGTSYQMRGFDGYRDWDTSNEVWLYAGDHVPTLVDTDTVTLTYDPITSNSNDMLADPSGHCLDGFGPITVTIP